jgi:ADP-ribose pyrophosphatase
MSGPDRTRRVYDGELFDVVVEEWEGRQREIVVHPGSTAVVAVDRNGYVTLVRQLREPARAHLIELPAGTLEPNEEPLESAQRELAEEVGLRGGRWRELARFYTTPGFCNERMYLFLAEDVERGDPDPDADEKLEVIHWHVDDVALRLAELEDVKTIAGLALFLSRRQ